MFIPNLSARTRLDEIMDDPSLDAAEHERALVALRRINTWSAAAKTLWRPIHALAKQQSNKPLRVLDIATGGGDVIVGLAARANKHNIAIEWQGSDISERALAFAREHAKNVGVVDQIQYSRGDALGEPLPGDYDIIMSTLFLHHLERDDAAALLRKMRDAAQRSVIVCDLDRCAMGYLLCRWFARCVTRSRVVHNDAVLSLRAAFTIDEARALANDAGMDDATVQRVWPRRWLLLWTKA